MPVKWTPEMDQTLLIKILETSEVSPKPTEISEKWPTDMERPTPRAISERIFKIRASAKASGATAPSSTPRKNAGVKKAVAKKPKATPSKRKRGDRMSEDDLDNDSESNPFKAANDNGSDASDEETPKKKSKANTTAAKRQTKDKDIVKVKTEEEENGLMPDDGEDGDYDHHFGGDGTMEFAF